MWCGAAEGRRAGTRKLLSAAQVPVDPPRRGGGQDRVQGVRGRGVLAGDRRGEVVLRAGIQDLLPGPGGQGPLLGLGDEVVGFDPGEGTGRLSAGAGGVLLGQGLLAAGRERAGQGDRGSGA